ncbi:hypothetical protein CcCBS67573_g04222 [Chytriomyces confervae]|uniref:G-protein coupled receptors family 3 profile domain-containing protein n=1 Tax=Chytriomyces confervae TaxID=246404 RepID=A0A507FG33_9FUNG|nr:hypothetical protein CcCBS67573_g04222 [Chytriomyces confervae]
MQGSLTNITIGIAHVYCLLGPVGFKDSQVTGEIGPGYIKQGSPGFDNLVYKTDIAIQSAVQLINDDPTTLPGVHINIKRFTDCGPWTPTSVETWSGSTGGYATAVMTTDIIERHSDVIGVLGFETSTTAKSVAQVLSLAQIPYCSGVSASPRLSNRNNFPYFWRTLSFNGFGDSLFRLFQAWNVQRIAILSQKGDDLSYSTLINLEKSLGGHGITVLGSFQVANPSDATYLSYISMSLMKTSARYIMILGQSEFTAHMMFELGNIGLVDSSRVYMGINYPDPRGNATEVFGNVFFDYIRGFIFIAQLGEVNSPIYNKSRDALRPFSGYNISNSDFDGSFLPNYFDCLNTMVKGFSNLLQSGATPQDLASRRLNSQMNSSLFQNTGYKGILSYPQPTQYDDTGDIKLRMLYLYMTGNDFEQIIFGETDADATSYSNHPGSEPVFFGGGSIPPPDGPIPAPSQIYGLNSIRGIIIITGSLLGILIMIFAAGILFEFRKNKLIRSASVPEIISICVGGFIICLSLLAYIGEVTVTTCKSRVVGVLLGFSLMVSPLVFKNAAVIAVSGAQTRLREKEVRLIILKFRIADILMIMIAVGLSIFWWLRSSMAPVVFHMPGSTYARCLEHKTGSSLMTSALYTYSGILLIGLAATSIFSFRVQMAAYNEGSLTSIVLVSILLGFCLHRGISESADDRTDFTTAVIKWALVMFVFGMVVGVRILAVWQEYQEKALLSKKTSTHSFFSQQRSSSNASARHSERSYVQDPTQKPRKIKFKMIEAGSRRSLFCYKRSFFYSSPWDTGVASIHFLEARSRVWLLVESLHSAECLVLSDSKDISQAGHFVHFKPALCSIKFEFESEALAASFCQECVLGVNQMKGR